MLDYKLVDVKLVEHIVEAIKSGIVSIVGDRFVVVAWADLASLPEDICLRIVGGDIVLDLPEADKVREIIGVSDE